MAIFCDARLMEMYKCVIADSFFGKIIFACFILEEIKYQGFELILFLEFVPVDEGLISGHSPF